MWKPVPGMAMLKTPVIWSNWALHNDKCFDAGLKSPDFFALLFQSMWMILSSFVLNTDRSSKKCTNNNVVFWSIPNRDGLKLTQKLLCRALPLLVLGWCVQTVGASSCVQH